MKKKPQFEFDTPVPPKPVDREPLWIVVLAVEEKQQILKPVEAKWNERAQEYRTSVFVFNHSKIVLSAKAEGVTESSTEVGDYIQYASRWHREAQAFGDGAAHILRLIAMSNRFWK